jgi:hypothetical protein
MSTTWGPAIDAEVSYRQQRVRADYHRKPRRHFFAFAHKTEPAVSSATVTAMPLQKTGQWVAPIGRRHAA